LALSSVIQQSINPTTRPQDPAHSFSQRLDDSNTDEDEVLAISDIEGLAISDIERMAISDFEVLAISDIKGLAYISDIKGLAYISDIKGLAISGVKDSCVLDTKGQECVCFRHVERRNSPT